MSDLVSGLPQPWSAPRLGITLGGVPLDKPVSIEIERKLVYQANTFHAEAALSIDSEQTWAWFDGQAQNGQPIIELSAGYLPPGAPEGSFSPDLQFVGVLDRLGVSPTSGRVQMRGRDLAALLIDTQTAEQFVNQTSSQIWTTLAGRHGLTPQVTATSTLVQRYFEIDYTLETLFRHGRARTEWDLAATLAELEGYDLFLDGYNLVAQPQQEPSAPFQLIWQPGQLSAGGAANAPRIEPWRDLALSSPIRVTVLSFGSKLGTVITATASGGGSSGRVRAYHVVKPNLTQSQAQQLAQQKVLQISRHAAGVEVELPAPDLTIKPSMGLALSGSGTSWDRTYYIDHQRVHVSMRGAHMSLSCKNVPPETGAFTAASAGGEAGAGSGGNPADGAAAAGNSATTSASSSGSGKFSLPDGGWMNQPAAQPYASLLQQTTPNGMTTSQWANMMGIESGFNPSVTSPTGAQGMAQILPSTAADPAFTTPFTGNAYNPNQALPWASQYLNGLTAHYGSVDAGVRAYSGGGYGLSDLGS